MQKQHKPTIELLSPAAGLKSGMSAIRAGADAVYIGGPDFGARRNAFNSMQDIETLTRYAHVFGAKVHMAMNTILFNDELAKARELAHQAWEIGVDALIIQDMAFLEMELPPIELHASTQAFNLDPARIKFLEDAGFARVILERGASLEQIRAIRAATNIELEAFIHGAICVSYSGQCYLGHAICERGGNRGICAQPCRSRYDLKDSEGRTLIKNAYLLSPSDLNLSNKIPQLIDAGVTAFKIEGRLKDEGYVVNNTAYYSRLLNELDIERASSGNVTYYFEPDPAKSFSRGFSLWFFNGPAAGMTSGESAKAVGEYIGTAVKVSNDYFELDNNAATLNNGDGICFATDSPGSEAVTGTNINNVSGSRVYPGKMAGIAAGTKIYRNFNRLFQPSATSVERLIDIKIEVEITGEKIAFAASDAKGVTARVELENNFEAARNDLLAEKSLRNSLAKSGGTIFRVTEVNITTANTSPVEKTKHILPFIPASTLNAARRELLDYFLNNRSLSYRRRERDFKHPAAPAPYPHKTLDHRANIANGLAEQFYRNHGVKQIENAFELIDPERRIGKEVMRTRYCIRRETGCCPIKNKFPQNFPKKLPPIARNPGNGALFLENNGMRLGLRFHCNSCEMSVIFLGNDR